MMCFLSFSLPNYFPPLLLYSLQCKTHTDHQCLCAGVSLSPLLGAAVVCRAFAAQGREHSGNHGAERDNRKQLTQSFTHTHTLNKKLDPVGCGKEKKSEKWIKCVCK
ncbi:hypothetical protein INR49_000655 [Caranx melampygus]|nr:hypothetical protein INR49_000655 [Caranx melampygus]